MIGVGDVPGDRRDSVRVPELTRDGVEIAERRASMTSAQPRSASERASARPRPREAPVMSASGMHRPYAAPIPLSSGNES